MLEKILKCKTCGAKLAEVIISETNESRISKDLKPLLTKYSILGCIDNKCIGEGSFNSGILEGSCFLGPLKDSYQLNLENTEILYQDGKEIASMILRIKKK